MFENKVAVVTGGAKGIGKAIAEQFRKEGAQVCVIDLLPNDYFVGDLADQAVLEDFVRKVIADYGHVDYLINNALPLMKGIDTCTYEEFNYCLLYTSLVGEYYIPDLKLPEESRPIGRWGRMHKAFLQEHRPDQYSALLLSGKLWTYLADLNEQAADRLACIVSQMQEAEGVTEELKALDQLAWVGAMNSIRSRAEEIILSEMIFV